MGDGPVWLDAGPGTTPCPALHSALPSLHPGTGGATALLGKCGIWTGEQCTVGIWLMLGNKKSCRCAVQWHFWSTLLPFWLEFEYIWPKFKDVFRNHCLDIFSHTKAQSAVQRWVVCTDYSLIGIWWWSWSWSAVHHPPDQTRCLQRGRDAGMELLCNVHNEGSN